MPSRVRPPVAHAASRGANVAIENCPMIFGWDDLAGRPWCSSRVLARDVSGVGESVPRTRLEEVGPVAVAKVIEITASSPTSFAEAAKAGIAKASETVHGIKGAWVSEESLVVENDAVTEFRVTMRVSFVLD
jgi:flavin-binding protein dodecin